MQDDRFEIQWSATVVGPVKGIIEVDIDSGKLIKIHILVLLAAIVVGGNDRKKKG
jgi:hypothetical protein